MSTTARAKQLAQIEEQLNNELAQIWEHFFRQMRELMGVQLFTQYCSDELRDIFKAVKEEQHENVFTQEHVKDIKSFLFTVWTREEWESITNWMSSVFDLKKDNRVHPRELPSPPFVASEETLETFRELVSEQPSPPVLFYIACMQYRAAYSILVNQYQEEAHAKS